MDIFNHRSQTDELHIELRRTLIEMVQQIGEDFLWDERNNLRFGMVIHRMQQRRVWDAFVEDAFKLKGTHWVKTVYELIYHGGVEYKAVVKCSALDDDAVVLVTMMGPNYKSTVAPLESFLRLSSCSEKGVCAIIAVNGCPYFHVYNPKADRLSYLPMGSTHAALTFVFF